MTEEEFNAKVEEYLGELFNKKINENRVRQRVIRELINDMFGDYNKLSDEEFIAKYSWTERLLFEKPLEPIEDKGDNILSNILDNNIERYSNYRLLNYGRETVYYLGPTFVYYMLNLVRETERIKKEFERRIKVLNEINEANIKILDLIKEIMNDKEDLNLSNLLTIVDKLVGNSISTNNFLLEASNRLDNIEKVVASIAPVMRHITRKTDESFAKVLDLEEQVDKLDREVTDIKYDAGIAANDANYLR